MNDFTQTIKNIIQNHGEEAFSTHQKAHAILMDLAHDQLRDRLLARHFVESGGYDLLKNPNPHTQNIIIRRLREDFSIEPNAAAWITHVFATALGLETEPLKPWGSAPEKVQWTFSPAGDSSPDPVTLSSNSVAIGMRHTVALLMDGTVVAHGRNEFLQCDLDHWRQITAVAAGDAHTVGLTVDGCVLASGRNDHDQCDVEGFTDIAAVYAFGDDTICVKKDGTALACGKSKLDLSHFEQIRSIAWHPEGVYGIRQDGHVMLSSPGWEEEDWALGLSDVAQIISTYVAGSIVLTNTGRVYKMNEPENYFAHLRDISAITDLTDGFALLRRDGMVRILPYDRSAPRKLSEADDWRGITAIFAKYKRVIGLTPEGRLLAACTDPDWLRRNGSLDFVKAWYPVGGAS